MNVATIRRGEIWLVNLGEGKGSIQGGVRPCIITSNDKANIHSPVINIIPITSQCKNKLPTHLSISTECGLIKESTAMAEQLTLIDKGMLIEKIGHLDTKTLNKLDVCLLIQCGLFNKIKSHMIRNKELQNLEFSRC